MIVDDREILLLQTNNIIGGLIHYRHGIVRIGYTIMQTSNSEVLELDVALLPNQCETTLAQYLVLVSISTVRLIRLSVANHISPIDLDRDILLAYSDIEVKPLVIFTQ